jgi:hypothetical protein
MGELIKLILPFFNTPKNYPQVLKKLASFAFYETYFITLLLRANPRFDSLCNSIESWGPVGKVTSIIPHYDVLNLFGFAIALVVALLTNMFQFHDRISDLLGIRRRFDRKSILIPLSVRVGSPVNKEKEAKIAQRRDHLMHTVFYKYASSRAENPLVDKHDIEQALNAWAWFWVSVEAVFYLGVGAAVAWWLGSRNLAFTFMGGSIALLVIAFLQRIRLPNYVRSEIDSIVADPTASYDIKKEFDAL